MARRAYAGFSLLEILVAVAILSASVLVLLSGQGSSFLASERAEHMTTAVNLARQKMSEVEMEVEADIAKNKFPEEDLEQTGEFDKPFGDYRWSYTIKKVEIPFVEGGEAEAENSLVLSYVKNITDQISKSVREIRVTILWGDKNAKEEDQPKLVVTTHVVKLR